MRTRRRRRRTVTAGTAGGDRRSRGADARCFTVITSGGEPAEERALAALVTGWRGAPPGHRDAAAAAVCAVARAEAEHPELAEPEVNPLLVHPGGALALDAPAVLRDPGAPYPAGN